MPLFVLTCIDKPGALQIRLDTREAHIAYARQGGAVRLGGPLLDDAGEMAGSLIILEAEDLAAAEAFGKADPYRQAGLFQSVEVRPFRVTLGALG